MWHLYMKFMSGSLTICWYEHVMTIHWMSSFWQNGEKLNTCAKYFELIQTMIYFNLNKCKCLKIFSKATISNWNKVNCSVDTVNTSQINYTILHKEVDLSKNKY